jgi:2-phospho-L-lactate/phosphoenolpyruvate guanylyltransferase
MILVPVKNFENSKQRLSPALTPEERRELAFAMLHDMLDAVAQWQSRPPVALVTSDLIAKELARERGFDIIGDDVNLSETDAIAMATRVTVEHGSVETLVIPADIPLVTAAELERVYAAAPERGIVIVPSAEMRGSNAVLRRPADLIPLRFGNDSFQPHLAAARATGLPCVVLESPGIALDVDTPADLAALLAQPARTRSQALLEQWNVRERLAATQPA